MKRQQKTKGDGDMRGVTDPAILLKSDQQRIDKNVYSPETANANMKAARVRT